MGASTDAAASLPATCAELNLSDVVTAVARRFPQRAAILRGDSSMSYAEMLSRSTRLAGVLSARGLGCFAERATLGGHECGQATMAQYLHNGAEYVEGLLGAYRARVAPFNVNYLYKSDELLYLLRDAAPAAIQYHSAFAPALAEVLPKLDMAPLLLQVHDDSGHGLLEGALDYERALASSAAEVAATPSPDDLYIIYTGGTTGMPKGVLWRQADVAVATLGLVNRREGREFSSLSELVEAVAQRPSRVLPCAPLMHGASQWAVLGCLGQGNTVVFPERADRFDARETLSAVERHQVDVMTIVGDAFAQPLANVLETGEFDARSLRVLVSGGAALHESMKIALQQLIPGLRIIENMGSSESGIQGSRRSTASGTGGSAFVPDGTTVVVADDHGHLLHPGESSSGWLARAGRIPLGYLGDPAKTARTFPVVDGHRVVIPGDRARLLADGRVELLGRDSLTINTGGEKVFVEEVESVIKDFPGVVDVLVCGRPSPRWGAEVAAVVQASADIDVDELLKFCRARLARYKVPKTIHRVTRVRRNPAGKGDYRWAADQFATGTGVATDRISKIPTRKVN